MNPLFQSSNSPTKTTKPTKAVNDASTHVSLTHNTFDNSYFNFKTQRYGKYEPFWWKVCVPGDNEPFSNSHNVRSLPFVSPIESPMKLNKDYFQVPMYAIQPNAWDYIYKNPTQGDDVPVDAQNLFPLFSTGDDPQSIFNLFLDSFSRLNGSGAEPTSLDYLVFIMYENFLSSGSLLFQLGYKLNPIFRLNEGSYSYYSYDELFDRLSDVDFSSVFTFDDPDSPSGNSSLSFTTNSASGDDNSIVVDHFTFFSLIRSHIGSLSSFDVHYSGDYIFGNFEVDFGNILVHTSGEGVSGVDSIRMDVINAYQLACAQYYVNPRVDFIYNAQLYRDNFIQLVRELASSTNPGNILSIASFDYNGIPVLYDYLSTSYYDYITPFLSFGDIGVNSSFVIPLARIIYYLFGFQDQLRFGDYLADSRPQMLGYGEPGSDVVQVMDNNVSVIDLSQKLVLQRFRGAVAHLDNSAEDYLETMFHETLPPDYHYPKFIVHSEFAINGDEVSNTTSDNQGMIVTNLKSGDDTSEFNIEISVPSILIGISYVSIPAVYSQIKERHYMHEDRFDMFQPMLQYLGDQAILNREVSDTIENPGDSYSYASRNAEYKQRLSQCSGAFLTSLRSWIFTVDLPLFGKESYFPRLVNHQSPIAIRTYDFQFNRFLRRQTGISLGTGFHFVMKYNNKNVDNRPMDVNPLPLYPSNSL